MDLFWFLRMSRWTRHPPGLRKVIALAVTVGLCLALYGIEHLWGWPDWLRVNPRHWKP